MRNLYKDLLLAFMLIMGLSVSAATFEAGGLYYNVLSGEDNTCEVTKKQTGNYIGDIVIPDTVVNAGVTYKVTRVGNNAFKKSGVTSVKFGDNVEVIGNIAFYYCKELKEVTFGKNLKSLGFQSFYCCYGLKSLVIPDKVHTINHNAFYECLALETLTLGKGLKLLDNCAFSNCSSLKEVVIPDSVTEIRDNVFYYCSSLEKLTIGKSVKAIYALAFGSCMSLKEIYNKAAVPPTLDVDGTGYYAFTSTDVSKITLFVPNGTVSAYKEAEGWKNFPQIFGEDYDLFLVDGLKYKVLSETDLTCETGPYRKVVDGGYDGSHYKGDIVIPEEIAHNGKTYKVTQIGHRTFFFADSVTSVKIGKNIIHIGTDAFIGTAGMEALVIPDNVISLGDYSLGSSGCDRIVLGKGLTTFDDRAMASCRGLKGIIVPDNVITLGRTTFYDCNNLVFAEIGDGVEKIETETFSRCFRLKSITLGRKVQSITGGILGESKELVEFNIKAAVPPTLEKDGNGNVITFNGGPDLKNVTLYVPEGTEEAYRKADGWKDFGAIVGRSFNEFSNNGLKFRAFSTASADCEIIYSFDETGQNTYTGDFVLPETVTDQNVTYSIKKIGVASFMNCKGITSFDFGNTLQEVGAAAFKGNKELKNLSIKAKIRKIGNSAFEGCENLETVEIGDSCTVIDDWAFYSDYNIKEYVLGRNVAKLGHYALELGRTQKLSLRNPVPIELVKEENGSFLAFGDAPNYTGCLLEVPVGTLEAYKNAEGWNKFLTIQDSGVETIDGDEVKVFANGGSIVVLGADETDVVEIFNLNGQLISRGFGNEFEVATGGIYIVRIAGETYKVIL